MQVLWAGIHAGRAEAREPAQVNAAIQLQHDPVPPHSVRAEQSVIGGLLQGANWADVADVVKPGDFYRPDHQVIFEAITTLATGGKPCDVVTVPEQLERSGKLEEAGGLAYLSQIARDTPKAANVRVYAEIVAENARLRWLRTTGAKVHELIANGVASGEIFEGLRVEWDSLREKNLDSKSINIRAFSVEEILAAIEPELMLLPGIPAEAYTLIAGALSSFKTTLLLYLLLWKATAWDILSLSQSDGGCDIGKSVLVSYEDTDKRIFAKLQRVIQHGYRHIGARFGERDAREFVERAARNLRRVTLAGDSTKGLVQRIAGAIVPNEGFITQITGAVQSFAPEGALIGIDPLRLAVVGSQNDDDGADVVVHTLNRIASTVPGSGVIVCSHSNKAGAKEPGSGFADAAYATSGSALYSQHARSNFLIARLKADEIRSLFSPKVVTDQEVTKQAVVRLTHGRLSHGSEGADVFLLQREGTLTRVDLQGATTAVDVIHTAGVAVLEALERMKDAGINPSANALEKDTALVRAVGSRKALRDVLHLLEENGHVHPAGKTKGKNFAATDSGRELLKSGENRRDTPNDG